MKGKKENVKIKKIMSSFLCIAIALVAAVPSLVEAKGRNIDASFIPKQLKPSCVIKFVNDSQYIYIKEGDSIENTKFEKKEDLDLEKPIFTEVYPSPEKGMVVTYGLDGQMNRIIFPSKESEEHFYSKDVNESNLLREALSKQINSNRSLTLIASWGSEPNKLYRTSNRKIYGKGRATVFGDTIGQGNHVLRKGDVATKLRWDNCVLGLTVNVTMKYKNSNQQVTHSMKKWDAGGMPNAIIDIWKTGIEKWGFNYSNSSLDNWSRKAEIIHDNRMI